MEGKLIELYYEAEKSDIDVDWIPMRECESLSVCLSDGSMAIAIDPWRMDTIAKETVCLAHELGHCNGGGFYNRYSPYDLVKKHELKADRWAVRRLIPREKYDTALKDGFQTIPELADHFDVTEDFMKKAVCYYTYGNLCTEQYF